ncbi:TRAP transporter small permease subunit [Kordiimonas pumila]|uniref:TRAP transporter small permease protein n=1 Tax=Kordiimonas pumila TaxID=2161677 RepID=A0ABV7D1A6_9PROT|nr:TRAP transporter small permease subunit [Kordiimonas pumila]
MLSKIVSGLNQILDISGKLLAILPLLLILVQFSVVLMVYVFSNGNIQLQESLQYINAIMFLGGAGYTALKDEHVRVDLFYSKFSGRQKACVNLIGTLLLLCPFLILFWISSVPYVFQSWHILEGSVEASGLPFIYILKSTLLLFAGTMTLHALSAIISNARILYGNKQ